MAAQREFLIYISSTFNDLTKEREEAVKIAARHGRVVQSRRADDEGVVAVCTADVRRCDVYVGIIGMRYGFQPAKADNPEDKSITEIEFDACEGEPAVPRLVFLKDYEFDSSNQDRPPTRIQAFRDGLQDGLGKTALPVKSLREFTDGLIEALWDARLRFHMANQGFGGAMGGPRSRKDLLKTVVVIGVSGDDDDLVAGANKRGDARFVFTTVSLKDAPWLAALDKAVRRAQTACLLVTSRGLKRVIDEGAEAWVAAALRNAQHCGRPLTLLLVGVTAAQLPPSWGGALQFDIQEQEPWDATLLNRLCAHQLRSAWTLPLPADPATEQIQAQLQAVHADTSPQPKLLLPIVVVAPLRQEMETLVDSERKAFAGFDDKRERSNRVSDFKRLAKKLRSPGATWPDQSYFDERFLWRCFGSQDRPVLRLLLDTIRSINEAREGSRERRLLPDLRIVPRLYRFDDLIADEFGSAQAVLDAAEGAALIVIDEFALLHPSLRKAARRLLELRRTAVVSICASDPAHSATRLLLGDYSFLQIGRLLTRFATDHDPRCEVAVNSVERLQRWLCLAIPELLALGDSAEVVPEYAARIDLSPTGPPR